MKLEMLIAFRNDVWLVLKGQIDAIANDRDAPTDVKKRFMNVLYSSESARYETIQKVYKSPLINGARYHLLSLILSSGELDIVNEIKDSYKDGMIIVGAFDYATGVQVGMTKEFNDVTLLYELSGTAKYPMAARVANFMPDDVTYDSEGRELARTAANGFKNSHRMSGQANKAA